MIFYQSDLTDVLFSDLLIFFKSSIIFILTLYQLETAPAWPSFVITSYSSHLLAACLFASRMPVSARSTQLYGALLLCTGNKGFKENKHVLGCTLFSTLI